MISGRHTYASAAGLLADILPLSSGMNATTLRQHVLHVAEWAEAELGVPVDAVMGLHRG